MLLWPAACGMVQPVSSRRAVVAGVAITAVPSAQAQEGFGRVEGFTARVEGIGGGADMLQGTPQTADVTYPPSVLGLWRCERVVVSVEGDRAQAQGAWFDLGGGTAEFGQAESFYTRFVPSPTGLQTDGGVGVVRDRGFEIDSRVNGAASVSWDVRALPNTLKYARRGGDTVELTVVERTVELPSDKGFGFNELIHVTSTAGGLFGSSQLIKAARIQRRYRRGYTDSGDRVIEGLEIVKTFRVLDGVAGVEMPTSTTKSKLRLSRPTVEQLRADRVKTWDS